MLILPAVLGWGFVGPLSAQRDSVSDLHVGDRLRVTAPTLGWVEWTGTLRAVGPDTLWIEPYGSFPRALPTARIERLERAIPTHGHGRIGAWVGGIGGVAVGAVIGMRRQREMASDCIPVGVAVACRSRSDGYRWWFLGSDWVLPSMTGFLGGAAGGVAGWLLGSLLRAGGWVSVDGVGPR